MVRLGAGTAPVSEDDLLDRVDLLIEAGRYEAALTRLTGRAAQWDEDPAFWARLTYVLRQLHRYPDALRAADRHCELDPDDWWGWLHRSSILDELDRVDEALDSAARAVRLGGDQPTALLRWAGAAVLQNRKQHADAAVKAVEEALALAPDDADTHTGAADIFEELDLDDRARTHYERALELEPEHAAALHNLGRLDFVELRFLRAETLMGASAALDPNDPASSYARKVLLDGWYLVSILGQLAVTPVAMLLAGLGSFWPVLHPVRVVLTGAVVLALLVWAVVLLLRSRFGPLTVMRGVDLPRGLRLLCGAAGTVLLAATTVLRGGWLWSGLTGTLLTLALGVAVSRWGRRRNLRLREGAAS